MAHDHSHSHSHTIAPDQSHQRAFIAGILLNGGFVLAELIAGFVYNSMALLTDAGHNASDVASLALSLVAFWMARKRSTAVFTYGYKKTTVLAALANAVVLLVAIGILGYESFMRLFYPQPVEGKVVAWIAGLGIVVNAISAMLFYQSRKKDLNIKSAYLHLMADALVSLGVVVAGILITYTNWFWVDPAIGIAVMIVILVSTWQLLKASFKMSIDAVPDGIELTEVKNIIMKQAHVVTVDHVHVWPLSTTENALTAHVVIDQDLKFEEKLTVIEKIKHELEHYNIQHSTIELK